MSHESKVRSLKYFVFDDDLLGRDALLNLCIDIVEKFNAERSTKNLLFTKLKETAITVLLKSSPTDDRRDAYIKYVHELDAIPWFFYIEEKKNSGLKNIFDRIVKHFTKCKNKKESFYELSYKPCGYCTMYGCERCDNYTIVQTKFLRDLINRLRKNSEIDVLAYFKSKTAYEECGLDDSKCYLKISKMQKRFEGI